MNYLFSHMPLLIAIVVILLGMIFMILMKGERSKRKRAIATMGFLLAFFGFIAVTVILYVTYFPRVR